MTTPAIIAFCVAIFFFAITIALYFKLNRHEFLLKCSDEGHRIKDARITAMQKEFEDLQQKFQKNPSYECQQLLANLLAGHALFHIETIDPENVFLRRR